MEKETLVKDKFAHGPLVNLSFSISMFIFFGSSSCVRAAGLLPSYFSRACCSRPAGHRVPVDVLPPDGKLLASFRTSLGSFLAAHRSPLPREECGRRDEGPHGPPRAPLPDLHRGREQWRAPRLRPWPVDAHNLVIHLDNARVAEQHPREKKREEKKETRHVAAQASELCSLATARLDGCFLQPQIGSARRSA